MVDDPRSLRRDLSRLQLAIRELTAITDRQTTQIDALRLALGVLGARSERFAADLSPLSAGISTIDVTWPNQFPDTAYGIHPTLVIGPANLGQVFATYTAKTTAGCTVVVRNTSGGAISAGIDVLAIRT